MESSRGSGRGMRWLDDITDSVGVDWSKLWERVASHSPWGRKETHTHTHTQKSQTRLSNQAAMCQELLHTVYWPPECETSQTANDGPGDYCWIILTFGFHSKTENSRDYLLFIFFFFFFPLTLYFLIAFISVWLHWVLAASKPGAPLHSHVALGHLGSVVLAHWL